MALLDQLHAERDAVMAIAARHGISSLRVFGSVARREETAESDVDFLVDMEASRSLLDMGGFLMDIQAHLKRRCDVTTASALHWYVRDRVLSEAQPL